MIELIVNVSLILKMVTMVRLWLTYYILEEKI